MATKSVKAACNASVAQLAPDLPAVYGAVAAQLTYRIQLVHVRDLSKRLRDDVYRLFDVNMGAMMAASSFATSEAEKRDELFDPATRYLLATRKANDNDELIGYLSFRFDTEETLDDKDAEVIYCYELQVAGSARKLGIGRTLLELYEAIGAKFGMEKAMLTLLKSNTQAGAFYKRQGYSPDEIDPTLMASMDEAVNGEEDEGEGEGEDEEADYTILSKRLSEQ